MSERPEKYVLSPTKVRRNAAIERKFAGFSRSVDEWTAILKPQIERIRRTTDPMPSTSISYLWRDPRSVEKYSTGVSLHSHTNQSQETLSFVADWTAQYGFVRPLMRYLDRRSWDRHGIRIDWLRSYWTPPLTPKLAWDLESGQIEKLGLRSLVSITDHDDIRAPLMLRTMDRSRHVPISVEWSAPYSDVQSFHIGVHNLPSARAAEWIARLNAFTANPADEQLGEILAELNQERDVLVVLNHPMWDLYLIGRDRHNFLVNEFLLKYGNYFHALELNGLRNWAENRAARRLAEQWNMLLVAGGDRHGVEANANINLTNASSFTEFVHEVRYERRSEVLFLPQYAEPWKMRILQSTIDAIRDFPEFPLGSQCWDDRVFHPDARGEIRPLSAIWPRGQAPRSMRMILATARSLGRRPLSSSLRYAWSDADELRFELGERETA